ncbi:MAG TPA: DNA internalization-related competence protein ComEC/Rec2 [Chloroflexi bacterium]|nr:DNA internalization-related competence protein ComEC/Rec2 [Chloroflexota bacterium]
MTLVWLSLAWASGIVLAQASNTPWTLWCALGLCALFGAWLGRDDGRVRLGAGCALALVLGAGRFMLAQPHFDETSLATYNDVGWVTLEGVIVGEPDERETRTFLRVRAERLTLPDGADVAVDGVVLVKAHRYPRRHYGDRVRVEGALDTPPVLEGFSYRDYLARRGIYSIIDRARVTLVAERQANPALYLLFKFKRYAQATIAAILPEPQAALLTGILLGVESGIPAGLMDDFAATGTTHIIAISGFNITIIASIFEKLTSRLFERRRALIVAIVGVMVYTIFVGASAAVVRAAVMGILYLLAQYLGRSTYAPVSLFGAGFFMTLHDPHVLWDVGFQLSFAATLGLMLYTNPLERGFERFLAKFMSVKEARKAVGFLSEALIVTLAAQITTTPLILYYFGRLSLVTLLTNLLILPVQSYVMIVGGVATMLGALWLPLGQIGGWVAWVFLTYTIEMVRLTAQVPFASAPVQMGSWMVGGYYALLAGLAWWRMLAEERRQELCSRFAANLPAKFVAGGAVVLLVLLVAFGRSLPDGRLHVVFLDVGQGDAIFIQTPTGKQILIDGGPSGTQVLAQLGRQMPFWDRTLDVVLLTHPDADHITGLIPVLERYRVSALVHRDVGCETSLCQHWHQLLELEGAIIHQGQAGLTLTFDDGVQMEVIHPGERLVGGATPNPNDNSIVARLTYGQFSILLPGDIEADVERQLAAQGASLQSIVLKAAHHGSCSSTTPEFLDAVKPELVVISVGADNRFGHPCDAVLERLEGLAVYRTDEHGAVAIISDGIEVWVRVR